MQTCPAQGGHLATSIVIGVLCLSILNQQLNKRQQYICSEQGIGHENRLSHIHPRTR